MMIIMKKFLLPPLPRSPDFPLQGAGVSNPGAEEEDAGGKSEFVSQQHAFVAANIDDDIHVELVELICKKQECQQFLTSGVFLSPL
jgi:hypothetical protein